MEINQQRIEDAVIAEVASKLIGDDDLYGRVKRAVDERVNAIFANSADAKITEAVEEAIKTGFDRQYFKTNSFGQAVSAPTTISKELERLIGDYWNTKVDSAGKPTTSSYNVTTRAEWMFMSMCAKDFSEDMKRHVVDMGGALKDALRKQLHETVNGLLSEVFKVRSLDDQGKSRRDSSLIQLPAAPVS